MYYPSKDVNKPNIKLIMMENAPTHTVMISHRRAFFVASKDSLYLPAAHEVLALLAYTIDAMPVGMQHNIVARMA